MNGKETPDDGNSSEQPTVIQPGESDSVTWDGFGVNWKIDGADTGERFAIVHHPMAPRVLAAPLHLHHNEDEYSYVLEGTLGALLGNEVVEAGPGSWVFKPRGQWHTFWNAGDSQCEIIEIISPAGFENAFREWADVGDNMELIQEIDEKYAIDVDYDSVPELCQRFEVTYPSPEDQ